MESAAPTPEADNTGSLAAAIALLAQKLTSPATPTIPRVQIREPDTFDGADPHQLRTFLLQCSLNFKERADAFSTDDAKVTYALSFLMGSAMDCFEPYLHDPHNPPLWLSSYDLFCEELESNFGSYDPEGEAEAEIEVLRMPENNRATKYFVEFNHLSSRIKWGEAALRRQAYNGLARHIKNEMVHHPKPTSLADLRKLVQAIDSRFWERKAEIVRDSITASNRQESKTESKTDKKAPGVQSKLPGKPVEKSKGAPLEFPKATAEIAGKLGRDGKLTPQERQHCLDNSLCLFCAKLGHIAEDCSKTNSFAPRTGPTTTKQDSAITPDTSSPYALMIQVTCELTKDLVLPLLVDSRLLDSFIDSHVVERHHLAAYTIPLVKLCLIDGTCNSVITQALKMHIHFPSGETHYITFYVTPLDLSCTIVLGHRWLTQHNPLIDWVKSSIIFRSTPSKPVLTTSVMSMVPPQIPIPA